MNQLREILDRVDVVMRRRRDQADSRSRMASLGNPRVDFVAGQLSAFTRFGPLRHFDLELVGLYQVEAGDTKSSRSNLLDSAVA